MNEKEAMKLYSKIADNSAKTAEALNKVAENIKQINDKNILHHTEVREQFKVLNSWVSKLIIILVLALAALAGVNQIIPLI